MYENLWRDLMKLVYTFATLIFFLLINMSAYSATVVFIKGDGVRIRDGKKTALTKDMEVKQRDIIETKSSSTVIVQIKDGTKIKIKENTRLTLTALSKNNNKIHLHEGGVFAKVDKLKKSERFQISSIHTLAGVRGTQFYIHTLKSKDIWLCVNEGVVDVSESQKKSKVAVKEGKGIAIRYEKKVGKPKEYKWTKKLNWNMESGKGEVEDKIDLEKNYDILDKDYD